MEIVNIVKNKITFYKYSNFMFLQDNRKIRKNTKHNKPLKERARKEA